MTSCSGLKWPFNPMQHYVVNHVADNKFKWTSLAIILMSDYSTLYELLLKRVLSSLTRAAISLMTILYFKRASATHFSHHARYC